MGRPNRCPIQGYRINGPSAQLMYTTVRSAQAMGTNRNVTNPRFGNSRHNEVDNLSNLGARRSKCCLKLHLLSRTRSRYFIWSPIWTRAASTTTCAGGGVPPRAVVEEDGLS